jgi:antirestriction protein ArdC
MPHTDLFESVEKYYSTLFHELGHSTGASTRLNREGVVNIDYFGSHQYASEELIAEMTAAMLCATTGIELQVEHSAAYIDHWMERIGRDHKLLMSAASAAQKAADCVLGVSSTQEASDNDEKVAA